MPRKPDMGRRDPGSASGASPWPVLVSAVLVSGALAAAVAAATLRYGVEPALGIASVRLGEMTAAYTTRAAAEGRTAEDVRAWGVALETALDAVAAHHGVVLLPARAVAAGAPDLTQEVEAALAAVLARGRAAGIATPPEDGR